MDSLWDTIKRSLIDSANVAAEKAEYLGKVGRARLDIAETRNAIRDGFADLGGLVYESHPKEAGSFDLGDRDDIKQLIQTTSSLEDQLQQREETLDGLRAEENGEEKADEA